MNYFGARDRNRTYLTLHVKQVTSPEERLGHESMLALLTGLEPVFPAPNANAMPVCFHLLTFNLQFY